ncbi:unnamed protein product [Clonostachys rosea]|uniref:Uncharacterized protein n=1 Tax=Bionectria ochroleuca TaxID=29856 RepID=A0ABY6UJ38_BIOOC|nr:unnamed protein product [Clonostachys rosea]
MDRSGSMNNGQRMEEAMQANDALITNGGDYVVSRYFSHPNPREWPQYFAVPRPPFAPIASILALDKATLSSHFWFIKQTIWDRVV